MNVGARSSSSIRMWLVNEFDYFNIVAIILSLPLGVADEV